MWILPFAIGWQRNTFHRQGIGLHQLQRMGLPSCAGPQYMVAIRRIRKKDFFSTNSVCFFKLIAKNSDYISDRFEILIAIDRLKIQIRWCIQPQFFRSNCCVFLLLSPSYLIGELYYRHCLAAMAIGNGNACMCNKRLIAFLKMIPSNLPSCFLNTITKFCLPIFDCKKAHSHCWKMFFQNRSKFVKVCWP